jgi:predicted small secreted protein
MAEHGVKTLLAGTGSKAIFSQREEGAGSEVLVLARNNLMKKRLLIVLLASTLLSMVATACHTVHGAGEDISATGNTIQRNTPP